MSREDRPDLVLQGQGLAALGGVDAGPDPGPPGNDPALGLDDGLRRLWPFDLAAVSLVEPGVPEVAGSRGRARCPCVGQAQCQPGPTQGPGDRAQDQAADPEV